MSSQCRFQVKASFKDGAETTKFLVKRGFDIWKQGSMLSGFDVLRLCTCGLIMIACTAEVEAIQRGHQRQISELKDELEKIKALHKLNTALVVVFAVAVTAAKGSM